MNVAGDLVAPAGALGSLTDMRASAASAPPPSLAEPVDVPQLLVDPFRMERMSQIKTLKSHSMYVRKPAENFATYVPQSHPPWSLYLCAQLCSTAGTQ